MPWEVEHIRGPAEPSRCGDVEDRQAHGQTTAAVDHADHIGVRGFVVCLAVTDEAEFAVEHERQGIGTFVGRLGMGCFRLEA
jgi:hypothetical protein